ncbi:hypothetical protein B5G20_04965 [Collinsella sp. An7]|uniref:hypothetical protein n=1 Tax=Collinsella sp. An7 TaxID=1965651 RepID=UPI000B37C4C1|nr:hypothetical protein [Collinsella sp. An7]OUN47319.1 hypothetical protein B5G20_04965 [Collinsella sp. An7]
MARMIAPYTGAEVDVPSVSVERWLARGFISVDEAGGVEADEAACERADEDYAGASGGEAGAERPDAGSTITEIRAYAEAHGVSLPKKANKAAMLAALEEAMA